jgi:hypothetical protein
MQEVLVNTDWEQDVSVPEPSDWEETLAVNGASGLQMSSTVSGSTSVADQDPVGSRPFLSEPEPDLGLNKLPYHNFFLYV